MDSDRPARDRDRDAAIRLVENAWADGQVVEADRDKRVDELRHAVTMREIEMLVDDLRPVGYDQQPDVPAPTATPPYPVAEGGAEAEEAEEELVADRPVVVTTWHVSSGRRPVSSQVRVPRIVFMVPVLIMLFVATSVVVSVVSAIRGAVDVVGDSVTDSPTLQPGQEPAADELNLFSVGGYDAMVTDLEQALGRSDAFSAVLYPTYAVVQAPVDGTSRRQQHFYWNGELDVSGSRGTSTEPRFDLREIDLRVVVRLVERVRSRVEDPTTWYAILHAPREGDGSVIQAYATNEFGETAYVVATATGKVVYASTPEPAPSP